MKSKMISQKILTYAKKIKSIRYKGGCCKICKTHYSEFSKRLAVDHDHNTGKIRGLLCLYCNTGLGKFKDSTKLLNEAIKYLEENTNGDQKV
jgi:hypothetical protein